ncbi:hypothetical protein DO021_08330 [Desulfobacter hydrogenophilus]|uniref:Uncharacterized protein n=1 Tax=Desulfobacter hydrogenophilus TaxID=2291 RepID=A0A328FCY5_9BACT|nr:hypothetical protein [Desulfobacter hydrogenophilus]NDY71614.1 hypothetical protein [Desulfobacter hydrogenophilus]QBH15391.1 hypothetical protein EYB58_22290 [Desulfobacter hydrogenophilus]RAM02468.1 hypothetical protein DO021_08330 [Desulfobacter hydrogenophilus]
MKLLFSFIFILSLTAGGAFGYYSHYDWIGYTIALAVSGFIGSSIIAILFSYLYLFQKDSVEHEPMPPEKTINHQQEIKKIKR